MTARPFAAFASLIVRALAWGNEGHEIITLIARGYLEPSFRAQVDYLLSLDKNSLAEDAEHQPS